jgi:FtsP/CotA-like multicopper oxidase with cupredoxin domain
VWLGLAVLVIALITGGYTWTMWASADIDTRGQVEFTTPLPVPPLLDPEPRPDGTKVFDLTAQAGSHDFGAGQSAQTWGFNGTYLGPTLRAEVGDQVRVDIQNNLEEATSVHWHGMHLPAAMDGGPHQEIAPGAKWSPTWEIDQNAATLWYHPHPHGKTAEHVYNGLAGLFILDDPGAAPERLPTEYGVDDLPVVVQDRNFDGNQLDRSLPQVPSVGITGDTIVVNGAIGPYVDVTTERVRLRLLNGSNGRVYDFGFADDRKFDVIASDGGLLPAPARRNHIMLSPGERAEIVVSVEPGEDAVMRSTTPDLGANTWDRRFAGGDDSFDVLQLRAADELTHSPDLPMTLAEAPQLAEGPIATTRTFELSGTKINDKTMDMSRIDFGTEVGTTERWEITNQDGIPHSFHVHDVQFQVVDVAGDDPPTELAGWKDTIYLRPRTTYRIVLRFEDYTDASTPYMFHCHILFHEDAGMMGQFVVLDDGDVPAAPERDGEHRGH